MKLLKVMTIIGTRPEAIKMIPVIKELEKYPERIQSIVVVTGQHRQMLDQILADFEVHPDYDLDIMQPNQTLVNVTTKVLSGVTLILESERPDIVLVHGDTTTAFASALAAFYQKIKVGHVEAGLRTWNKYSPFPEEMNRQLIDELTDIYFAPTKESKVNLLKENHPEAKIYVTGNTGIDTLKYTIETSYTNDVLKMMGTNHRMILLTMHRRENIGKPMEEIFQIIPILVNEYKDIEIVFPVHKNPKVRTLAKKYLSNIERVHLIEPLDVKDFQNMGARSHLILTDSGGIQEEAPSLGKPVLVLRDTTERPEGVSAGTLKLVGTNGLTVYTEVKKLLTNQEAYRKMAQAINPYGDGNASHRIVQALLKEFGI
ncbi:non-hydrolyzing UDP-N-acetylglucosamine 2-epimerase [Enterococcus faecalis]|uniref:non-hydrolyzing UDP-N-acetylglucosamine 2-epimerase n=1 Tax=Enterococcus faecalis TaxID=1351 RepID=UPI0025AF95A2|nr:UDP-N-acetylglucosamine 2-epimerase (non-hydrolyzing) [Enterococcus faecalis]MDN3185218.1 UDP-N-acetylglucosamine 2-epimerase (non-hydrolyzing) [Enterococcus faecalis]